MRIIAVALSTVVGSASADTLIASHTDDALVITKVDGDKATKVFEEKGPATTAFAYAFGGTSLWVLRRNNSSGAITLGKVDGDKAGATKTITFADFKLKKDPGLPAGMSEPGIMATTGGQVWLSRCTDMKMGNRMTCTRRVYARVDDASMTLADKAPKDVAFEFGKPDVVPKAIARAPKGYAIKIAAQKLKGQRFDGIECNGPSGKLVWPKESDLSPDMVDELSFVPHAVKTAWVSASPAIAHVSLQGQTPMGERLNGDLYVVECKAQGDTLLPIPGGGWVLGTNVVKADGTTIGTIPGTDAVISP